jgi:hypothetical protein
MGVDSSVHHLRLTRGRRRRIWVCEMPPVSAELMIHVVQSLRNSFEAMSGHIGWRAHPAKGEP